MAQNDKIFCGAAKRMKGRYGEFFVISFSPDDVETLLNNRRANGWLNLRMNERKNPSRSGNTHYLEIDTWEPDSGRRSESRGGDQRSGRREPPAADPDYGPPTASGRDDGGFGADNPPPPPPEMPPVDDDIPF